MNDRIAQMAREAGLHINGQTSEERIAACARFARLVAEDCAKFAEPDAEHRRHPHEYLGGKEGIDLLDGVAKVLRARYSKD